MKPPEPAAAAAAGGNDSPEEIPKAPTALAGTERTAQPGRLPALWEQLGTQARRAGLREANQRHRADTSGQLQVPSNRDTPFQWPHVLADTSIGPAESGHGKARGGCISSAALSSSSSSPAHQGLAAGPRGLITVVWRAECPLSRRGVPGVRRASGWRCQQGHKLSASKAGLFCRQRRQQGRGAAAFSDLCSLAIAPLPAQDREFDCADQSGGEIKAVRQGQSPA